MPYVLRGIDRYVVDGYKDSKNELNEHFNINGCKEDVLDLSSVRRTIPAYMSQEVRDKCVELFNFAHFRISC